MDPDLTCNHKPLVFKTVIFQATSKILSWNLNHLLSNWTQFFVFLVSRDIPHNYSSMARRTNCSVFGNLNQFLRGIFLTNQFVRGIFFANQLLCGFIIFVWKKWNLTVFFCEMKHFLDGFRNSKRNWPVKKWL